MMNVFDFINEIGLNDIELDKIIIGNKRKILKYSDIDIGLWGYDEMLVFYKMKFEGNEFVIYKRFFRNIILEERRDNWKGDLKDQMLLIFDEMNFNHELVKDLKDIIINYLYYLKNSSNAMGTNFKIMILE